MVIVGGCHDGGGVAQLLGVETVVELEVFVDVFELNYLGVDDVGVAQGRRSGDAPHIACGHLVAAWLRHDYLPDFRDELFVVGQSGLEAYLLFFGECQLVWHNPLGEFVADFHDVVVVDIVENAFARYRVDFHSGRSVGVGRRRLVDIVFAA